METSTHAPDDPVGAAIAEYLSLCDAGTPPDRDAFLNRHADIAPSLAAFLDDHARMRRAAPAPDATIDQSAPALPPAAGDRVRYVGDYELVAELARGGMGVVYRARQASANRPVAVKMILAGEFAGADAIARFRREAEAAANLDHPNILPIYEVGTHDGLPYYSMKLAEGGSLADRLPALRADLRAAAELFGEVARAVHFAHQRGVLHRDLKPANVLLDADGTPFVTDFGLAKRLNETDGGQTRTGAVVGTPAYMAPEQARGDKGITTAADVYSLGAILFELLAGRPPFQGETVMGTLQQVLNQEPADPRSVDPAADRDLSAVALKCLAKEPAGRYGTAAELADELDRWRAGEPVVARPPGRVGRFVKTVRRNPALSAAVGGLVFALAAGTVVSGYFAAKAGVRAFQAEVNARETLVQFEEATRQRERADHLLYCSRVALAQREGAALNWGGLDHLLAACPADRRGWEWEYLRRTYRGRLGTVGPAGGKGVRSAAVGYRPGANELAVLGSDGVLRFFDAVTLAPGRTLDVGLREPNAEYPFLAHGMRLEFFPDGRRLAVAAAGHPAAVWDVAAGRRVAATPAVAGVEGLAVSPDGRWLATAPPVRLWDAATGAAGPVWADARAVAFAPAGGWAAVIVGGTVRVRDVGTGADRLTFNPKPESPARPDRVAVSPDGKLVAAVAGRLATVWTADTGTPVHELAAAGYVGDTHRDLRFSPDGSLLALAHTDRDYLGGLTVWDVTDGRLACDRNRYESGAEGLAFRPDGRRLVTAHVHDPAGVWAGRPGQQAAGVGVPAATLRAVEPLPDGRLWSLWTTGEADAPGAIAERPVGDGDTAAVWAWAARHPAQTAVSRAAGLIAVAPSGGRGVAAGAAVVLYDAATGREVRRLPDDRPPPPADGMKLFAGWEGTVRPLRFSLDGRRLLVVREAEADAVEVWDPHAGRRERRLPGRGTFAFDTEPGDVLGSAWAADGRTLALAVHPGAVELWDAATGDRRRTIRVGGTVRDGLTFAPDGRGLAVGASARRPGGGTEVVVYDTDTGAERLALAGLVDAVHRVAFSPDGRRLASADAGGRFLKVWDTATGEELLRFDGRSVTDLVFTADGRRLVVGNSQMWVYDGTPDS